MSVSVEIVVDDVAVIARSVVAARVVVAPSSQGISPQMKKHSIPMSKTFQKFQENKQSSSVKSPQQRLITD